MPPRKKGMKSSPSNTTYLVTRYDFPGDAGKVVGRGVSREDAERCVEHLKGECMKLTIEPERGN